MTFFQWSILSSKIGLEAQPKVLSLLYIGFNCFLLALSTCRADLRPGDVIIAINGTKIINANEVAKIIEEQEVFSMTVLRNGEQVEIENVKSELV